MKWLILLLPSAILIAIGWWRWCRSQSPQTVSARWVLDQERQDLIQGRQWDGFVRWPWNVTSDDQECA